MDFEGTFYYYVGTLPDSNAAINANWQRLDSSTTLTIKEGESLYINWLYNTTMLVNGVNNYSTLFLLGATNSAGVYVYIVYKVPIQENATYTITQDGADED